MDLKLCNLKIAIIIAVVAILPDVKAENEDENSGIVTFHQNLLNRLEILEGREKMRDNENKELKNRILVLESFAKERQKEIINLKETIEEQNIVNRKLHERVLYLESRDKTRDMLQTNLKSQNKRIQSMEWFIRKFANKCLSDRQDPYDKEHELNTFKGEDSEVKRIKKRQNEMNVAFLAYLDNHIENPGVHQIVAFDHVITNIGNAYNAHAGDFRAPVAGTYVFATTLMAGDQHLTYHFKIMHNGKTVSNIYITNGGTGSQEVVLKLNQGDDVSIHNIDAGKKLYGHGYSTFSGFLLQQDYSNPAVIGK